MMIETSDQPAVKSPDTRQAQLFIRLDCSDPTGQEVNAALVSSINMWVRCMWPDLAVMKRGPAPEYAPLLKDCQIPSAYKVYELRGRVIKKKKLYGDAQEFRIKADVATDITSKAQLALLSAKAYYDSKRDWPVDDNF